MVGNLSQETDQFMQAWKTDVKIYDDYVSLWSLPLGGDPNGNNHSGSFLGKNDHLRGTFLLIASALSK